MNTYAMDFLAEGSGLDLTLEGSGKKKKKKKAKAPAAPIAGYDAATGAPIYDEVIGYDTRTGKPIYAQQQARLQQLRTGAGQQIVGYDDFGEPIYGPAQAPIGYPMQPGFTPMQPGLAAVGQGSLFESFAGAGPAEQMPPMPPGWTPQAWQNYLYAQRMGAAAQQGLQGQGPSFFSLVGDSGPSGPQPGYGGDFVDYESAGGFGYTGEEDQGASFLDQGDFEALGAGMDIPASSPLSRAVGGTPEAGQGTRESRERARALIAPERGAEARAAGAQSPMLQPAAAAALPMFKAVAGSGCCRCEQYKKYPRRDAIRDPF